MQLVEQLFWVAALAAVCAVTYRLMARGSRGHDGCEGEAPPPPLVQISKPRKRGGRGQ